MRFRTKRALRVLLLFSVARGGVWAPASAEGQVPASLSIVQGRVLEHETETALAGASVSLTSTSPGEGAIRTESREGDGRFAFQDVPPGIYSLEVSLFGYRNLVDTLRVAAGSQLDLTLPLSTSPLRLEPIVVVSRRRSPGPIQGFEMRRQRAAGTFMDREEIETANPHQFSDLLRRIPGVRIVPTGGFGSRVEFRGGCTPDLWVDGTLSNTTPDLDSFLAPEAVESIEVYQGAYLPMEFGSNLCGAIVVSTRMGADERSEKKSLRRQLIYAGSFLVLAAISILVR